MCAGCLTDCMPRLQISRKLLSTDSFIMKQRGTETPVSFRGFLDFLGFLDFFGLFDFLGVIHVLFNSNSILRKFIILNTAEVCGAAAPQENNPSKILANSWLKFKKVCMTGRTQAQSRNDSKTKSAQFGNDLAKSMQANCIQTTILCT